MCANEDPTSRQVRGDLRRFCGIFERVAYLGTLSQHDSNIIGLAESQLQSQVDDKGFLWDAVLLPKKRRAVVAFGGLFEFDKRLARAGLSCIRVFWVCGVIIDCESS